VIKTKSIIPLLLLLVLGGMTMNASAHALWVESKDIAEVGDVQRVYSIFGHAGSSSGIYVPLMDAAYLVTPAGDKIDLALKTGNWLAGFGWCEYEYGDILLYWPGDYVFAVARSPSVYDPGWGGTQPSNPRLGYSYATMVIHAGDEGMESWEAGLPLEIVPEKAPYEIAAKDEVTFHVMWNGEPVEATYSAYYWTWDAHDEDKIQTGTTDADGAFTASFTQAGPWQVMARVDLDEPGTWTATYDHSAGRFKAGDEVEYNVVRYTNVMSVWVKA
jgi:cobalt/nickel transport protein